MTETPEWYIKLHFILTAMCAISLARKHYRPICKDKEWAKELSNVKEWATELSDVKEERLFMRKDKKRIFSKDKILTEIIGGEERGRLVQVSM